jgi:3-oxoacyl-[acyl-carrier-protein] synthase-1
MPKRIFITGIGMISAIGTHVEEALDSLVHMRAGLGEITLFPTIHRGALPIAEVKQSHAELLNLAGLSGRNDLTRTTLLGMIAAREAFRSAGITGPPPNRTGVISATTVGGMDRSERFYERFLEDVSHGRLMDVVNHDCGDSTERIASFLGIRDLVTTISTACSSSANAILFGAELIRHGRIDRIVAGGTDSVTRFTLNGFNTLMILDKRGCRPFDDTRAGLTLGEGAAYLVLESEDLVTSGKRPVLAELTGYGNANDAFHQTASSPEGTGAVLAMSEALKTAGLTPSLISYINVHGTGTENNDLSEGLALKQVFGDGIPPFSSTKTYTGHTLGAAGAMEAVISVLSIREGMIFPNLRWSTPMKELPLEPVTSVMKNIDIKHVLSNSFGFGGNNTTLILSRPAARDNSA